jgi:hypothetical protein
MAQVNSPASAPVLPGDGPIYIVEEQDNPSTDYFVLPVCSAAHRPVHRRRFTELPTPSELAGAVVIFVRYLPGPWKRLVERVRPQLSALVFFMDDDVLDPAASSGMPWRYRYKLFSLAARHESWLRRQHATLWVSTGWLARKYESWAPQLVAPQPLAAGAGARRVFYHGSASHDAEIRWLRPVVEQVLRADECVHFEITGGQDVYRLYRGLPRVTVVHPMKWPAYQAFMDMPGRHIGLAPLLDVPFNKSRSCTKFFDITRCGAVGLYAREGICAEVVRDGVDGLLLPMQPQAWAEAILALARDESRCRELLANARTELADALTSPGQASQSR